jgi:uncharacterized SAM-binding protein YcdF (DUF218 family)
MNLDHIPGFLIRVLLMPPTSLLALILFGYLLRRRWLQTGRVLSALGVILLLVVSTNAGALLLVRPLEEMNAPLNLARPSGAQAIVVLGAGSVDGAPEYGGLDVPDAVALVRLQYAAYLQHETGLPLLASGGNGSVAKGLTPKAAAMARTLREDFRTPVKWVEDQSADTAQNAANSARILKAAGIGRVLLVTHAMHMPRAREAFSKNGIEVVAAPTMFYSRARWSAYMLLPSASGLYRSYYATHEWVGLAWYRLKSK